MMNYFKKSRQKSSFQDVFKELLSYWRNFRVFLCLKETTCACFSQLQAFLVTSLANNFKDFHRYEKLCNARLICLCLHSTKSWRRRSKGRRKTRNITPCLRVVLHRWPRSTRLMNHLEMMLLLMLGFNYLANSKETFLRQCNKAGARNIAKYLPHSLIESESLLYHET